MTHRQQRSAGMICLLYAVIILWMESNGVLTGVEAYGAWNTSWMNVGTCGQGLTCGPDCQLLCLKQHNYYRFLHNSPPLECDPDLAQSAQEWTDEQAAASEKGDMHNSQWTDSFTETISWKGEGSAGMDTIEGAIPGAVRIWYSEIKNDYNYQNGKSASGQAVGNFQAVIWKAETMLGCGINIKANDGTYVTAHYAPASHASATYHADAVINVTPRIAINQTCDIISSSRELCSETLVAPYVTPEQCLMAGCCYDDMFMSEPSVWFYAADGRKWCFVGN